MEDFLHHLGCIGLTRQAGKPISWDKPGMRYQPSKFVLQNSSNSCGALPQSLAQLQLVDFLANVRLWNQVQCLQSEVSWSWRKTEQLHVLFSFQFGNLENCSLHEIMCFFLFPSVQVMVSWWLVLVAIRNSESPRLERDVVFGICLAPSPYEATVSYPRHPVIPPEVWCLDGIFGGSN